MGNDESSSDEESKKGPKGGDSGGDGNGSSGSPGDQNFNYYSKDGTGTGTLYSNGQISYDG